MLLLLQRTTFINILNFISKKFLNIIYEFKSNLFVRYWLFGEKINNKDPKQRIRGWFPRQCAVEMMEIKKDE